MKHDRGQNKAPGGFGRWLAVTTMEGLGHYANTGRKLNLSGEIPCAGKRGIGFTHLRTPGAVGRTYHTGGVGG
jgi:hypothetical protein